MRIAPAVALLFALSLYAATPTLAPAAEQRAECFAYIKYEWRSLGTNSLAQCASARAKLVGRCVRSGEAFYGRWGDKTLRLVTAGTEVSNDNRQFSRWAPPDRKCAPPPDGSVPLFADAPMASPSARPPSQRGGASGYYDAAIAAIIEDSGSWTYDRLVAGSIRPNSMTVEGGTTIVRGAYDVRNGIMGDSRKSFAVRFVGGRVSCVEYSSYAGVCDPVRTAADRARPPPPPKQYDVCVNGRGEVVGTPDAFGSCGPQ